MTRPRMFTITAAITRAKQAEDDPPVRVQLGPELAGHSRLARGGGVLWSMSDVRCPTDDFGINRSACCAT